MVFQCFTVVYFCTRCKINAKINSNYDQTISKMVFFAYKATQYIVNFKIYKQKQVEKNPKQLTTTSHFWENNINVNSQFLSPWSVHK